MASGSWKLLFIFIDNKVFNKVAWGVRVPGGGWRVAGRRGERGAQWRAAPTCGAGGRYELELNEWRSCMNGAVAAMNVSRKCEARFSTLTVAWYTCIRPAPFALRSAPCAQHCSILDLMQEFQARNIIQTWPSTILSQLQLFFIALPTQNNVGDRNTSYYWVKLDSVCCTQFTLVID